MNRAGLSRLLRCIAGPVTVTVHSSTVRVYRALARHELGVAAISAHAQGTGVL